MNRIRIALWSMLLLFTVPSLAHESEEAEVQETEEQTTMQRNDSTKTFLYRLRKPINFVKSFIGLFSDYDTTYVEPNHYNWATMMQATTNYETLSLHDKDNLSNLTLGSRPSVNVGPYLGWGIFFFGYTFDVTAIGKPKPKKTEFELSFYTTWICGDLFYRRTGQDFSINSASHLGDNITAHPEFDPYRGQELQGIKLSMIGANLYYIVNRRRFSLPAGFAQSTMQRRSAGSWKFGVSITKHNLDFDYQRLGEQVPPLQDISPYQSVKMDYMDYSLSAGYAYNWVFKPRWLLSIDMAPAIGYKRTHRSLWITDDDYLADNPASEYMHNFFVSRGNVNFNVTGRFGIVWNNGHHFAGMSLIAHNFNYRYRDLTMHNSFLTLNFYAGLNFMRKKGQ